MGTVERSRRLMGKDLSRREFFRGAGLFVAGAATAGIVSACSSGEPRGTATAPASQGRSSESTAATPQISSSTRPRELPSGLLSGMTLTSWTRGELGDPAKGGLQVQKIADTGANLITFTPTSYQNGAEATVINQNQEKTSTNEEIAARIQQAHKLGMAVMLKPHVDPSENNSIWRGFIGEGFTPEEANKWFKSYKEFIVPYAQFAEENGVEIFSVGCEFKGLSGYADQWRDVVKAVREVYNGKVTYAANYDEQIQWHDAVDIMGSDMYPPLDTSSATASTVASFWQDQIGNLVQYSQQIGKPVLLTEVGCSSSAAGWTKPNVPVASSDNIVHPDQNVQAVWYNAFLNALAQQKDPKNVIGASIWNWNPDPTKEMASPPSQDTSLSPQGKVAQVVYTKFNEKNHIQRLPAK